MEIFEIHMQSNLRTRLRTRRLRLFAKRGLSFAGDTDFVIIH